ncbi:hypothetical protein LZ32DRAFT_99348 [Colletotrichum eremochloae]|nr:hypothetical protein LZ32DRAFT_99348 [Colletotrichum eremochloae]
MFPRSVNMGPPTFAFLRRFPTRRNQGPFHELLSRGPSLTPPSAVTHRINTGPKARPSGMRVASTLGRVCCQILLKFRKGLLALRPPLWYSPRPVFAGTKVSYIAAGCGQCPILMSPCAYGRGDESSNSELIHYFLHSVSQSRMMAGEVWANRDK